MLQIGQAGSACAWFYASWSAASQRQAIDRTIRSIPQALDFIEAREYEGACGVKIERFGLSRSGTKVVIDGH